MRPTDAWAVCPGPDNISDARQPKTFPTLIGAKRFLGDKKLSPQLQVKQEEALRQLRDGQLSDIHFPQSLIPRRNREKGWEGPYQIVGVDKGPKRALLFEKFLPIEQLGPIPSMSRDRLSYGSNTRKWPTAPVLRLWGVGHLLYLPSLMKYKKILIGSQ